MRQTVLYSFFSFRKISDLPDMSPPPLDELRLGIIIGLALSFRNLLGKLPDGKPAFIFNIIALNYMLGGYQFGKTRMIFACLANLFCKSFEFLVERFWGAAGDALTESFVSSLRGACLNRVTPVRSTPARANSPPMDSSHRWIMQPQPSPFIFWRRDPPPSLLQRIRTFFIPR